MNGVFRQGNVNLVRSRVGIKGNILVFNEFVNLRQIIANAPVFRQTIVGIKFFQLEIGPVAISFRWPWQAVGVMHLVNDVAPSVGQDEVL